MKWALIAALLVSVAANVAQAVRPNTLDVATVRYVQDNCWFSQSHSLDCN